jgi:hypothetical protein
MTDLTKILNNPEEHYPGNFDTPQRANAMLTGLCQDAANEIDRLNAEVERLKANIALDKMAENARELGLDYEPAVQEKCFLCGERVDSCASDVCPKSAQPAVQEGRDWSLLEATQESLREHMAEIKRLKAAQPAPVKTYHDGKPWPVAPKPWVGLTEEEFEDIELGCRSTPFGKIEAMQKVEAKLKGKNHG